jgi:hypothetical protein
MPDRFVFVAPADPDLDQGDDPDLCSSCGAGRHEECRDGAVFTGPDGYEDVEVCECTDGACGPPGEWREIGYLTEGMGQVFVAPVGTPAPIADVLERAVARSRAAGYQPSPPLAVSGVENRRDGTHVTVDVPVTHPAHRVIVEHASRDLSLSVDPGAPDGDLVVFDRHTGFVLYPPAAAPLTHADKRDYDESPARRGVSAMTNPTSGLGREHIERHLAVPPPLPFSLPEALGGLPEDAAEQPAYRPNRRARRRRR